MYALDPKIAALTLCFVGCTCADASLVESTPTAPAVPMIEDMTQADEGSERRPSAVDMRADAADMASPEDMRPSPMDLGPDLVEDMSAPPVPARCASAPRVCQDPEAVEHQITPLDGCAFGLKPESVLPQARASRSRPSRLI